MLCRALLAAVVFTYVLCVLVLSGIQKEDLDASTIRKLQRHNINIDDINEPLLQKECLGKTDMPVTLTTLQMIPATEKTDINITGYGSKGSPAEDTTPIQKIFEYLELLRKEEKNKSLVTEKNTNKSELEFEPLSKLSSFSFRDRVQQTNFEVPSSETPLLKIVFRKKHKEKIDTANLNTELENLMTILRANINRLPNTAPQETSTVKIVKDVPISKNTKDVDYITKIVEEIISKRQLKEVNATTDPKPNLNTSQTFRDEDEISDSHTKNKSISLTNFYLNNCKLKNFYANNQGDKEKFEILNSDKSLRSGINEAQRNSNDIILKGKKQKISPDQKDDPIFNHILNELKKESQMIKLLDQDSKIRKAFEPISQTPYPFIIPKNETVKSDNTDKEGLNIIYEKPLENQSTSIISNGVSDRNNISDAYKDGFQVSGGESNKALQIVLQTQSKLFNQILNQQRNLLKMCNNEKEKFKLHDNESSEPLKPVFKNQTNSKVIDKHDKPMVKMHTYKEEQYHYPTYINENIQKLEPKLEEKKHAKIIVKSPPLHYQLTKSDNDVTNDEYKRWRLAESNTLNNEDQAKEPINNRMDEKFKTTNTFNGIEYDQNLNKEYKRPWFYAELSKKQPKFKINGNKQGIFFIPNDHKQITNTIDPRLKKDYEKRWSPYFDNNTSITKTDEYLKPKTQQSTLVDLPNESLSGSNNRHLLRDLMAPSKTFPKIVEMYQSDIKSPDVIEDFEIKQEKKTNRVPCRTVYGNRIEYLSASEYKSDCAYLGNNHSKKQKSNIKDRIKETEAFTNNIETKSNIDRFSLRPKQPFDNYSTLGRYKTKSDEILSKNETKEIIKTPAFPPNVINDIAKSIKDFVLRDLKTTTTGTTTTTATTTTTKSPTTSTIIMTTTTPKATSTTPTTISTTSKSTTTEEIMTTSAKNPLKIQDASKVLEKMMEMFERLKLMKETLKPENSTHAQYVTALKVITEGQERPAKQNETNPYYTQMKEENRISHYPQPLQQYIENIESYGPQAAQLQIPNQNAENRVPLDPGSIKQSPDNRDPYRSQPVQMKEETRLQYYSSPLQQHPENRLSYFSQASQRKPENQTPYTPGNVQFKIEKSTPYLPQTVRLKTESRLPYGYPDLQRWQRNPEDNTPNYLQLLQRNQGSNKLNIPQALLKAENQYNPQTVQNYPENRVPYVPENLTYVPDAFELKTENRIRNIPLALQSKTENRYPYELQPVQRNAENRDPYLPSSLKYLTQATELQVQNRMPFSLQGGKTENHSPFDPPPLQHNSNDRAYDYSVMEPYRPSIIEFDRNLKEVKAPVFQKQTKPATVKEVITVQTNSGEISPLKIVLQKPFFQNVIITTQPPVTVRHSADTYRYRKPIIKANRHQVELKETEVMKDMKEYTSRHAHKDTRMSNPKPRKTKKERDVIQRYVPRDLDEIRSFHEMLERPGESWPREQEKIVKRVQRPIVKNNKYDDTHFRNFLETQQKVNAMLEKILASGKTKPISVEVI